MRIGDPNFDRILLSANLISSNNKEEDKKFLFYYVCIFVRLALYSLALIYHDSKLLPYIVLFLALFSTINLSWSLYQGFDNQWWSKKFQLGISILLVISSIMLILNIISNTYIIPIILYFSLIIGIIESLLNP